MKTWPIISGIILLIGIFAILWIGSFEHQNNCRFETSSIFPFIFCEPEPEWIMPPQGPGGWIESEMKRPIPHPERKESSFLEWL